MFLYLYITFKLGYLRDSNAEAHSVDSDTFYAVIYRPARSKTYDNLLFLKVVSNCACMHQRGVTRHRDKSTYVPIWTMFGHKTIHINLPFISSRKWMYVEIV